MRERELRKSWMLAGIALMMSVFMLFILTRPVQAAGTVKSGSYTYTAVSTGDYPNIKTAIYRQKTGSSKKKIATVSGWATLQFVYGNNLYFEKEHVDDPELIDFCTLDLKTFKTKRILANAIVVSRCNQYVVLMPNTGAVVPLRCTLYNLKTGNSKVLTNYCLKAVISDKKIYFAVAPGQVTSSGWKTRIYSCSLSGTGKKAVSGYFTTEGCYELTSTYVRYSRNGKMYKYTF